ncbi:hypothetical protein CTAYLR_005434 [Chrysophaeum taylorii]|uniref:Succinate dehydrogenase assembly factor 3 n=1 Tax=Chrysophaeum taylorii TaxID=2483200 RepID=A0AAD7UK94_9STRA|nr:hypothetical protein CTAYLR_005434 [Chrysophaeum taylorii]
MDGVRLLRRILREHRRLPTPEMRRLGDKYVVKEFRDHRGVSDVGQLARFFAGWEAYLADIQSQCVRRTSRFGANLTDEVVDAMNDDQRQRLVDLRLSAAKND